MGPPRLLVHRISERLFVALEQLGVDEIFGSPGSGLVGSHGRFADEANLDRTQITLDRIYRGFIERYARYGRENVDATRRETELADRPSASAFALRQGAGHVPALVSRNRLACH